MIKKNVEQIELDSNKKIKIGVILSYITIFINIIAGILYTPWMLRQIGDSNYGLFTLANSFISMFLLDFGMSSAVSRFVSRYRALNDENAMTMFLGIVYKLYITIAAVIFVILTVIFFRLDTIYARLSPDELETFKVVYIITATFSVCSFPFVTLNGILRSYEFFLQLRVCELLNKILTIVFTIVILSINGGLYSLISINLGFNVVFIIVKLLIIKKKINIRINWKAKNREMTKSLFGFSAWTTVSTVSQQLTINIMPSLIAALSSSVAVARFSLARTIESYVWTISEAINGLFLAKVTRRVVNNGGCENILPLMTKVGRIILTITCFVNGGLILFGNKFITLWLGSREYTEVYYMIVILILYTLISPTQQIANTTIIAMNKVKYTAIINATSVVFNLIIAYILIPRIGAMGAALSIAISYLVRMLAMNVVYVSVLKINVFKFFYGCHLKMMPAFVIVFGIMTLFKLFVSTANSWLGLVTECAVYGFVYLCTMFFTGWNKEEKGLLLSMFKIKKKS